SKKDTKKKTADLRDPENVQTEVSYDEKSGTYQVGTTLGSGDKKTGKQTGKNTTTDSNRNTSANNSRTNSRTGSNSKSPNYTNLPKKLRRKNNRRRRRNNPSEPSPRENRRRQQPRARATPMFLISTIGIEARVYY
ncbi:MAG: hypothetical protein J6X44_05780, partial [Thermoguttaceae bacterium]|nr:hypothetical protein [Thermoguttaceae bacterium]